MLVVTRKVGQGLTIGKKGDVLDGPIHVSLLDRAGNQQRIGIAAPPDILILRDELVPPTEDHDNG